MAVVDKKVTTPTVYLFFSFFDVVEHFPYQYSIIRDKPFTALRNMQLKKKKTNILINMFRNCVSVEQHIRIMMSNKTDKPFDSVTSDQYLCSALYTLLFRENVLMFF